MCELMILDKFISFGIVKDAHNTLHGSQHLMTKKNVYSSVVRFFYHKRLLFDIGCNITFISIIQNSITDVMHACGPNDIPQKVLSRIRPIIVLLIK